MKSPLAITFIRRNCEDNFLMSNYVLTFNLPLSTTLLLIYQGFFPFNFLLQIILIFCKENNLRYMQCFMAFFAFKIEDIHCVKSVQIRSYFWSVFSFIQSEYRKIGTRNNFAFGHFLRSDMRRELSLLFLDI